MRTEGEWSPWEIHPVLYQRGGVRRVPAEAAPLGRQLPYRRAQGESPGPPADFLEEVFTRGWRVDIGPNRGLGDFLYLLSIVQAFHDATRQLTGKTAPLVYRGPHTRLMKSCGIAMECHEDESVHEVTTGDDAGWDVVAHLLRSSDWPVPGPALLPGVPSTLPTWLDEVGDGLVDVHTALPMRHYLEVEQRLGLRLPHDTAPVPRYTAHTSPVERHVTFVATTGDVYKDYGLPGFAAVARCLMAQQHSARWSFTVVTPDTRTDPADAFAGIPHTWAGAVGLAECVEIFAASEVVIGNDTGLTHLAALVERPDGTAPQVIGLYGKYNFAKWTTGSNWYHSVATSFSQMLMLGDGDINVDRIDARTWQRGGRVGSIPPQGLAEFAARCAQW